MSISRRNVILGAAGSSLAAGMAGPLGLSSAFAQGAPTSVLETPEFYAGEKALYEAAAKEGMIISNNTGPTWANWAALFRNFSARYPAVNMVYNDVGSGVAVNSLERTKNRPQVDTIYYFGANGVDAQKRGLLAAHKPPNFDKLPASAKHPDGEWFTIHQLEIVFIVNKKLVKETPKSFADLLKPEYKSSIMYLDPRTTGVGQVLFWAANFANGGTYADLKPGADYMEKLHKSGNVLRVVGTTPYAQFIKGEIPIWVNFVNDGLRSKFIDGLGDSVDVVSPSEGTVAAPYTISLVKNGPNPNAGKLWLNYILSDKGQQLFAEGFVTPSVPGVTIPADVDAKLVKHAKSTLLDLDKGSPQTAELQKSWAKAALGQ